MNFKRSNIKQSILEAIWEAVMAHNDPERELALGFNIFEDNSFFTSETKKTWMSFSADLVDYHKEQQEEKKERKKLSFQIIVTEFADGSVPKYELKWHIDGMDDKAKDGTIDKYEIEPSLYRNFVIEAMKEYLTK